MREALAGATQAVCVMPPLLARKADDCSVLASASRLAMMLKVTIAAVANEMMRHDFEYTHETFASKAANVPDGSHGLLLLPYLEGERTPNIPDGTGVMLGINQRTFSASHYCRAAMEGVTLGMNYGLRRLAELGMEPNQIRATGGGAKSKVWRQIMADIFNTEVVTLKVTEGAAYGAALQALWCWRQQQGEKVNIIDITDEFVTLNPTETATPKKETVAIYRELQALQDDLSRSLRGVFEKHRKFVLS